MPDRAQRIVDEKSVRDAFAVEEQAAWDALPPERAEAYLAWILRARSQWVRRDRCAALRTWLRLGIAEKGPRSGLTNPRWWEVVLDPFAWFGGRG